MSRYNFRPNLTDHAHLQMLVRPFFNASDQDFNFVFKKLTSFTHAEVRNTDRNVLLTFTKKYHRDGFSWGSLQFHRKPLGFIAVARLSSDPVLQAKEYEKIEHRFANIVSQYESYIFDSRCIVIGPNNPSITISKKNILYIPETQEEITEEFVTFISDFIMSVFVVLESKRFEKMSEDCDRMQLPTTQSEPEQTVSESDTRFLKKKCFGRNRKLLADLCLLAGLYNEALAHYSISLKSLRNVNDYLWIGSAIEGLCACSVMAGFGDSTVTKTRNSLSIDFNSLTIDKPNISANVPVDRAVEEERGNTFLNSDEMVEKYKECLNCYKKFDTGLVQLEAHFKFIRLLLKEKRKIEIAEVVQDLLQLASQLAFSDMEKIEFSLMLASIHDQLSLHRKAAFYRRQVAVHYFKNNNQSKPVLSQALVLLNQVRPIYKLDLVERNNATNSELCDGWRTVQSRILLDMLLISERLRNKLEVVRLLMFILAEYSSYISEHDHEYLVDLLEEYSDAIEPLTNESNPELDTKLIQPLPVIRHFSAKKLAHYLQPMKPPVSNGNSPFIFSSLYIRHKDKEKEKIVWVCEDVAEVAMVVDNPLPAEIKVNEMTLLTEGSEFEAHPATLALPAKSGAFPFMLLGTPIKPGSLTITGYKVEILCITNTVLLPQPITVEVTPALPILRLSSTLPNVTNAKGFEEENTQTLFTSANLYHGHSCTGQVMLQNAGKVPITKLDIKLKKPLEKNVVFDENFVQSSLPLPPGETMSIDVIIMPEHAWLFCVNKDKLEVSVTIKYSYEEQCSNEYNREISWVTYVKVMPSLEFSNYAFHEIERHPTCYTISFDAINMTSLSMSVTSELKIVDHDVSHLQYCLSKKCFDLMSKKTTSVEIHFPRLLLPQPTSIRKTIEDAYQELICDSIILNWRLTDTNYSGVTYLQDIKVIPEILPVLKPKDIRIDISMNEIKLDDGQCFDAVECQLVNIQIQLTNIRGENIENIVVNVNPYQECPRTGKEMKQLCLPSGCLYKGIKNLHPGETLEHSCGLLFLYYGKYLVDISCFINEKFETPGREKAAVMDVSSTSRDRTRVPVNPRHQYPTPLSPKTAFSKLKCEQASFWEQTFIINVK